MANHNIASGEKYETVADWAAYVKALGTLIEDETGTLTENKAYTWNSNSDLTFSAALLNGNTITLQVEESVRHTGASGTGARISGSGGWTTFYYAKYLTLKYIETINTHTRCRGMNYEYATGWHCLDSIPNDTVRSYPCTEVKHGSFLYACKSSGGSRAIQNALGGELWHCEGTGSRLTGIYSRRARGCKAYGNDGDDWVVQDASVQDYNASTDGTHAASNGVTFSIATDLEADGYTPKAGGALDGAGFNYGYVTEDLSGNTFADPPAIGAYAVVSTSGVENIYFGADKPDAIYFGEDEVDAIYYGSTLVYEK